MKIDYDKQEHLWQIWGTEPPRKLLAKAKKVVLKVPSILTDAGQLRHGYLVVNGVLTLDNQIATISKEKRHG